MCLLNDIKVEAKRKGWIVDIFDAPDMPGGDGINVYVHPKKIKITEDNKEEYELYFASWFMGIGDECECD
jgi:hypothetical protein